MSNRILFVDDEPEFVKAHIETLEDAGYSVVHVGGYSEAFAILQEESFDLIILDLILPFDDYDLDNRTFGLDAQVGLRLHKAIREELGVTEVPIIFFTVVGETEVRSRIYKVEANYNAGHEILVKPKLPSSLLLKVRNLISRRKG